MEGRLKFLPWLFLGSARQMKTLLPPVRAVGCWWVWSRCWCWCNHTGTGLVVSALRYLPLLSVTNWNIKQILVGVCGNRVTFSMFSDKPTSMCFTRSARYSLLLSPWFWESIPWSTVCVIEICGLREVLVLVPVFTDCDYIMRINVNFISSRRLSSLRKTFIAL